MWVTPEQFPLTFLQQTTTLRGRFAAGKEKLAKLKSIGLKLVLFPETLLRDYMVFSTKAAQV